MAMKDISDLQVCEAYRDCRDEHGDIGCWPYELLMQRTGQSAKVCLRVMERADARGLVDYGVSLRSGWLTEKGKSLLGNASQQTKKGTRDE